MLMLHHYGREENSSYKLRFQSEKTRKNHNIKHYIATVGKEQCQKLIFGHAFAGCDTSSFYGIGKTSIFKHFMQYEELKEIASIFLSSGRSHEEIHKAGERAACILYKGNASENINFLRQKLLTNKVIKAISFVKPERLPPTQPALKYHSFRCYYQISTWSNSNNNLHPCQWGWVEKENKYYPMTTDQSAAPESLLIIIHCRCSTDCTTIRCSCRKHGLPCSKVCGKCQTNDCSNIDKLQDISESSDEVDT